MIDPPAGGLTRAAPGWNDTPMAWLGEVQSSAFLGLGPMGERVEPYEVIAPGAPADEGIWRGYSLYIRNRRVPLLESPILQLEVSIWHDTASIPTAPRFRSAPGRETKWTPGRS